MKKIVLFGAGGFGREVASIIEVLNTISPVYELVGFLDDGTDFSEGIMINGYPFLGRREWIINHKEDVVCVCTIGNSKIRSIIQRELTGQGVTFETIIAFGSYVGPYTELGDGCVLYGGITVSVNCKIGAGVLLNQQVNIGHDVTIGDFTTIMPTTGISGNCIVGSEVLIGGHSFIIPGRKIGDGATVAAGSIVFSNVKAGTTVLGNPAKRMKALE